jgi:nucleoside-diphosphate-sugar epimerase
MSQNQTIGIVGLGWLGLALAESLSLQDKTIWGTVSSAEKQSDLNEKPFKTLHWEAKTGLTSELKHFLPQTDILVFNVPPSRFSQEEYFSTLTEIVGEMTEESIVLFASSTGVYSQVNGEVDEKYVFKGAELENINLKAEILLKKLKPKNHTILRLAGLIGEDRNPVKYLSKKPSNDNPETPVNLIHRMDIIELISRLLKVPLLGETLNVVNPSHPTRRDYYINKAKLFNQQIPHFTQIQDLSAKKMVNCSKLISYLGSYTFHEI